MKPHLLSKDNVCRVCDTPINPSKIWCDDLCRKWNEIMTKEMWRANEKPAQEDWDAFCIKYYGEKKPMFQT